MTGIIQEKWLAGNPTQERLEQLDCLDMTTSTQIDLLEWRGDIAEIEYEPKKNKFEIKDC